MFVSVVSTHHIGGVPQGVVIVDVAASAAHNAGGFEGIRAHTNQRETHADAARVRSASRTRVTQAHRNDPDVRRDLRNRRSRTLSYARRGSRLWRRPGSRVRVPL